jgi:hypothetical protein
LANFVPVGSQPVRVLANLQTFSNALRA